MKLRGTPYFSKAIRIHSSGLIGGSPVDLLAGAYNVNILDVLYYSIE